MSHSASKYSVPDDTEHASVFRTPDRLDPLDPESNHVPLILPPYAAKCRVPFLNEERNLPHFNKYAYANSQHPSGQLKKIRVGSWETHILKNDF